MQKWTITNLEGFYLLLRIIRFFIKKIIFSRHIKKIIFSRYQNDIKMNGKILFSEQQKYPPIMLWISMIALLAVPGIFIYGLIQQVVHGQPWGDNPMDNLSLIIIAISVTMIIIAALVVLWIVRLELVISTTDVSVKYFPFHRSFRKFSWNEISKASVIKINPLRYGGWGMRTGSGFGLRVGLDGMKLTNFLYSRRLIYTISGKYVLLLELKNGKKVMIGTRKEKELEAVIYKIERTNKEY